jgi:hypothetical protein
MIIGSVHVILALIKAITVMRLAALCERAADAELINDRLQPLVSVNSCMHTVLANKGSFLDGINSSREYVGREEISHY